jgi:hypothetical protein
MYAQVKRARTFAVQHSKSFLIAATVIVVWYALFAGAMASISNPNPINESLEKVLAKPKPVKPSPALVAARKPSIGLQGQPTSAKQ